MKNTTIIVIYEQFIFHSSLSRGATSETLCLDVDKIRSLGEGPQGTLRYPNTATNDGTVGLISENLMEARSSLPNENSSKNVHNEPFQTMV